MPSPAAILGHTSCGAAMRRPRVPYVYAQVGWFLAACALLGAAIGTLYAGLKGAR